MHWEPVFNIAWCCQPHRMGHGQHFNLKMDLDGWMVIGIYDFIDRPVDNVPSMCVWAVWCLVTTGFHLLLHGHRRLLRVWQYLIKLTRFRELGHTKSQSEFDTSKFSGLDNTAVITSKMFLDAMADLFGNRCALCNTARDEIHIPWVNYHLVVDHDEGAGKNLGLWGPLWPFESSYTSNVTRGRIYCNIFAKLQENISNNIFEEYWKRHVDLMKTEGYR